MADKLMYIPNDYTKYSFYRLHLQVETFDTQLNEPTNQNLIKVPTVVKTTKKTSVINRPMSLLDNKRICNTI